VDAAGEGVTIAAMKRSLPWIVIALGLVACRRSAPVPAESSEPAGAPAAHASNGHEAEPPAAAQPSASSVAGLTFDPQPGWVEATPSSSMRKAQYALAGAEGAADAELALFVFPGGGGSVEANIERWCSQFEQPDGRPTREAARTTSETRGALSVHTFDVQGTYVAETAPGSGVRRNEAGWRLLAAIVEGGESPIYVRCVGPAATVEHWSASVDAFLASLRP